MSPTLRMPASGTETVPGELTPAYYLADAQLGPYMIGLLARCSSVFAIKATLSADLDNPAAVGLDDRGGVIEPGAHVSGDVIVQSGARIEAGARVTGPVLVCEGAVVAAGAYVRDHVVIGPGTQVGFGAEITRSLLGAHVFAKHPCFIGDAIVGSGVNFGAFSSTTGLLTSEGPVTEPAVKEIFVTLRGQKYATGQTKFGAVIGDGVTLSAGTVLCPGTLIGPGTVIYPRTQLGGFMPAGSRVR
ncbi:hypothetical protein J0X20_02640 [Streptomyces sp. KCTC 0041BP]|uniref:hypothetical protein n=1 Tax=Streptomyces sp. KCTC 0041BP TaxID=201500 RepID=UPI001AE19B42|nr:hypothetical protein [Streptomyces sp. KCTC 0041BP]MBP0932522.1 hypothetical protein [Streptomyces sp. KCTC 0041BP]